MPDIELAISRTPTDRLPMNKGERVIIEDTIDAKFAARDAKTAIDIAKIRTVAWVALCVSVASLLVQLARIVSIQIHSP